MSRRRAKGQSKLQANVQAKVQMAGKSRIQQWDQQPDEPPGAFVQFQLYLDQPREDRHVNKSYFDWKERRTGTRPAPRHPPGSFYELAEKYQWKVRARAFDRHSDGRVYAMIDARRAKIKLETMEFGRMLRERAHAAAKMLVPVTQTVETRDGREVIVVATKMTPNEISRMARAGVEIEQLAIGKPTSRMEMPGGLNSSTTLTVDNVREEFMRRIDQIRDRRLAALEAAEGRPHGE